MAILITTSRRTNQRTRRFAKELNWIIPFSIKINRGHMSLNDLREYMYRKGFSRLIIISSRKGNPNKITFLIPDIRRFQTILNLEVKSMILQIDKGLKKIVNELEIVYYGGDKIIFEKLREFIGEYLYDPTRENGVKAKMIIASNTDDYSVLKIIDGEKKEIYPRLIVRRAEDR